MILCSFEYLACQELKELEMPMTAYEIFRTLSLEFHWAKESRRVRWLAARYYSGADSHDVLRSHSEPSPVCRDATIAPLLTVGQVSMITMLR